MSVCAPVARILLPNLLANLRCDSHMGVESDKGPFGIACAHFRVQDECFCKVNEGLVQYVSSGTGQYIEVNGHTVPWYFNTYLAVREQIL